jgi:hypothetical protein
LRRNGKNISLVNTLCKRLVCKDITIFIDCCREYCSFINNFFLVKEEKPNISGGTIAMFSIAGFYLIMEWIVNTVSRFM